jgi:diguanylate cyclase (GGDEF)-like protein
MTTGAAPCATQPALPEPASSLHWIDGLAALSGLRNRDRLAASLAEVIHGLLQPLQVQVWRAVGHEGDQRWLPQARLLGGQYQPPPSLGSLDWQELQPVTDLPRWPEATPAGEPGPALSCFLVGKEAERAGALLLQPVRALNAADERLIAGVLRMYENMLVLLDYGERDELTGLHNRRTFDDNFLRRTSGAVGLAPVAGTDRRSVLATQSWLGVIDIDHFKRVNDAHGHLVGDQVLLLVARLIRESFRLDDMVYRFGGEEFVALLRCADAQQAQRAFERMRQRVAAYAFPRVGGISVSIGFTEVRPGDMPNAAFERADRATYHAKQSGRNQVCDHAALLAAGLLRDEQPKGGLQRP